MKKLLLSIVTFCLIFISTVSEAQTSYTWNGTTNTSWGTSTNWTPNGVPGSSDYIVIQTGTNALKLTSDKTIERFRINSGTMDLDGYTLNVNDQLLMYGGTTTEGKIIQNATNSAYINNATVNCKLDLVATTVTIRYSDMADSVKVKQTLSWGTIYWRGNRFYKHLDIENTSNGNMNLGNNPADSCFDGLTMTGRRIRFGYQHQGSYVQGDVEINATGASGTSVSVASGGFGPEVYVDGNIIINKSGTGACGFASVAGSSHLTMTSGHSIMEGTSGFTEGEIIIKGLTQLGTGGGIYLNSGADAQILTIAPVDSIPKIGVLDIDLDEVSIDGALVRDSASIVAEVLEVVDNTFNGSTSIVHTGTVSSQNGGNVFYGNTEITKSVSAGNFIWGYTSSDTVFANLSLNIQNGGNLIAGFYHGVVLEGDLTCDEQSGNILLGDSWGGKVVFAGTADQYVTLEETNTPISRTIQVDKPSGRVILNDLMDIDGDLTFVNGVIETVGAGLVKIEDGVTVSGVSNDSYVEGSVQKIGNDAFTFPVGRNGFYRPISISAPSNTSDAFEAKYFESNSDLIHDHSNKDASLNYLSTNEYWTLTRENGTSTPKVTLSWDTATSCAITRTVKYVHVAGWDGSNWDDLGWGALGGNLNVGTVETASGVNDFNMFILENDKPIDCKDFGMVYSNDTIAAMDTLTVIDISSGLRLSTTVSLSIDSCGPEFRVPQLAFM